MNSATARLSHWQILMAWGKWYPGPADPVHGIWAHRQAVAAAAQGAEVQVLAGCCGLAGNFGMERGHYDVSVAVAEHALLPALRAAEEGTVLLADGFSCRTQADQLAGWPSQHLAELLAPPQ